MDAEVLPGQQGGAGPPDHHVLAKEPDPERTSARQIFDPGHRMPVVDQDRIVDHGRALRSARLPDDTREGVWTTMRLRLGLTFHHVFYAPYYVALHRGLFADQGLDVTTTVPGDGRLILAAQASSDLDVALG